MSVISLVQRHALLDAALKRLSGAVDLLEAAAVRLDHAEAERRDLDAVLAAMEEDRGRLAEELDAALTAKRGLTEAVDEVAGRLRSAGSALRALMAPSEADRGDDLPATEVPPASGDSPATRQLSAIRHPSAIRDEGDP